MTVKSALRLVIGCVIIWVILSLVLPKLGIPTSRMLPAPISYSSSAKGSADAYITALTSRPTSNIMHSIETDYLVDYQFRAPTAPEMGNAVPKEGTTVYKGESKVPQTEYGNLKVGDELKVSYVTSDPEVNLISINGAGNNALGHGSFFGLWMIVVIVTLVLGYVLAPWLERIILRENF